MNDVKQSAFEFIDRHREEMTALWAVLVSHESGSADKAGVDGLAQRIADILAHDGADTRIVEFENAGNLLIATVGGNRDAAPVGLLGHYDTVFPRGTIEKRPFVIDDGKAYGPGVLDMKGGIVALLFATKALRAAGYTHRPIKIILAGDEEVAHSRSNAAEIIQQEISGCVAAFNFETGLWNFFHFHFSVRSDKQKFGIRKSFLDFLRNGYSREDMSSCSAAAH